MQFAYHQPMPCGNAAKLILNPGASDVSWRVLRLTSDAFAGPDDPAALRVYDGDSRHINDFLGLINGVTYWYAAYPRDASGVYGAPVKATVTPTIEFDDCSVDVQEVVRARLEVTLAAMLSTGRLAITKPSIPVLSIPFAGRDTQLPVVTVLLGSDGSDTRAIGDDLLSDELAGDGWIGVDGWLSRVEIDITAMSLNGEERNLIRKAIKAALAASLPAFEDAGMVQVDVRVRDEEDFQSMDVPIFKTLITLTCQAATGVSGTAGLIESVLLERN